MKRTTCKPRRDQTGRFAKRKAAEDKKPRGTVRCWRCKQLCANRDAYIVHERFCEGTPDVVL